MIKILQYGEGNFLRTFADAYFDTLNEEGGEYEIHIVKPIPFGSVEKFRKQNNVYHIVLRGVENGQAVEKVREIHAVRSVIDPFTDAESYYALAKDEALKIVISNTTEAGICFNASDRREDFETITYPAKLTKFLWERFSAGLDGVYLLPVELIDNNADELKKCVDRYIELWNLPDAFKKWNDERNFYCNTLVDRIVSGYPREENLKKHLETLVGGADELISVGEPFGLWAVEKKGCIADFVQEGKHNIDVVLTDDIGYYKKRKVRVLNGSHTNLVPAALFAGATTVYDCMQDEKLAKFVETMLGREIIPFVSDDIAATTDFADSVTERFRNPYLNHQLTSIALNSVSKWRARVLPSFKDYYARYGTLPENLTIGFSYLMALYERATADADGYFVQLTTRKIALVDDRAYLEYFANGGSVKNFMAKSEIWGEDLTKYENFAIIVNENLEKIRKGVCIL